MSLKIVVQRPYEFLPSGILIVEPNKGLLAARSMLLAAADYYVNVSGMVPGQRQAEGAREVAVAVLSESLGAETLRAIASAVRQNWPKARILIFGRRGAAIEDNLYDARIDDQARPEALLAALLALSVDPWNQRAKISAYLGYGASSRLGRGAAGALAESDPKKRTLPTPEQSYPRDLPGGEPRFTLAADLQQTAARSHLPL